MFCKVLYIFIYKKGIQRFLYQTLIFWIV